VLDELISEQERFCADCYEHTLRFALVEAARKGDRNFLVCSNCHARWTPDPSDVAGSIDGWMLVFTLEDRLAAVLCADCAASHPEPAISLPTITRLILERSRGPMQ
jgi:hypothetical protein